MTSEVLPVDINRLSHKIDSVVISFHTRTGFGVGDVYTGRAVCLMGAEMAFECVDNSAV